VIGAESADLIITGNHRLVALRHDGRAVIAITSTMDIYLIRDWRAIPGTLNELVAIPGRLGIDDKGSLCQEKEYFPFFVPEARLASYASAPAFNIREQLQKAQPEDIQKKITAFLKDD